MLWFKKKSQISRSIDDEFALKIKRYQLKQRVATACTDTTDYDRQLRDYCQNNCNNPLVLVRVYGYRTYLIEQGCTEQEASRLVLEEYR